MTIYKLRRDIDPDVFDGDPDIHDFRWRAEDVAADAVDFGMTPEEFTEAFLEEDTEARFWLEFSDSFDVHPTIILRLAGADRQSVWSGTLADAGVTEDDENYSNKLDEFFQKELGIAPDDWEIG